MQQNAQFSNQNAYNGARSFENLDMANQHQPQTQQQAYSPYTPQHSSHPIDYSQPQQHPLNEYIPTQNPFSQSYDNQGYINPPEDQNLQRGNFSKKQFEVEFYQEQGSSNFTGYNSRVQHGFNDLNYDYNRNNAYGYGNSYNDGYSQHNSYHRQTSQGYSVPQGGQPPLARSQSYTGHQAPPGVDFYNDPNPYVPQD
jgi:hypothetical protein